jgi:hypothetical protein
MRKGDNQVRAVHCIPIIKILILEEERLIYRMITPNTPKKIKEKLLQAIEEFEERRSI